MNKINKISENIPSYISKIKGYLESHPKVVFAYLFGSLAKDKFTPLSDIDIAIYLLDEMNIIQEKMDILGKFIELLETDELDMVILNTASLPLKARIVMDKKVIMDKDPFVRHKFESLVLREYFDFSVKEMEIFKRRYLNGR